MDNWLNNQGRDDQVRRTARVLDIIQQIAITPWRWSRATLAQHHEISERMIQKDLEIIRIRLGLKLLHDGQAYAFEHLPSLPTTQYSFQEALALLTAARAAQALPGVNSADLAAAITRLEAVFPEELIPLLRQAMEQLPKRTCKNTRQERLALIHRSMAERRCLQILYSTASRDGKVKERTVDPYELLPYGRSWHLVAFDHDREEILQFKVDRILQATLIDTPYSLPPDFDIDEYLGDAWGIMRGSAGEPEEVALLFEPQAGQWVAEEQWHKSQKCEVLDDGQLRISFFVGVTPEMINWLLYYGGKVYIESPDWLREEVKNQHIEPYS